jgi:hypothetical protein
MADSCIPADRLHSVGVVVRDLELAARRYAEIFDLNDWDINRYDAENLTDVQIRGRTVPPPTFRTATATTNPPRDTGWGGTAEGNSAVTFELVQPLTGESIFQEFRFRRRQGICHLCLAEVSADTFDSIRARLRELGVCLLSSMTVGGRVRRHFFDTRPVLGGYIVEVDVPLDDREPSRPSESWDLRRTYTRPRQVGPVPVFGVNHFGVVVDDVMSTMERYHEVFGIEH